MVRPLDWYSIFNPGNSTESIFELQYMLEGPNSPLYNWFSHTNTSGNDRRYLGNPTNITLNATEILYPPVLPDYTTSDTIRLKTYSSFAGLHTNGSGSGDRKSTRLNSSHKCASRMPYSACKK